MGVFDTIRQKIAQLEAGIKAGQSSQANGGILSSLLADVSSLENGFVTATSVRGAKPTECTPRSNFQNGQNPSNGMLSATPGYVFYSREASIGPDDSSTNVLVIQDQPLVVPNGFVLVILDMYIEPFGDIVPDSFDGHLNPISADYPAFGVFIGPTIDKPLFLPVSSGFGAGLVPGFPMIPLVEIEFTNNTGGAGNLTPNTVIGAWRGVWGLKQKRYVGGNQSLYFPFQMTGAVNKAFYKFLICVQGILIPDQFQPECISAL